MSGLYVSKFGDVYRIKEQGTYVLVENVTNKTKSYLPLDKIRREISSGFLRKFEG